MTSPIAGAGVAPAMVEWQLVIHGGCGALGPGQLPDAVERAGLAGLRQALAAGAALLERGGSAVDSVEAAVRVLEDDQAFNAGRGSALTHDGRVELEAAIMDGRTRSAGAATGLRSVRAPVSLARAIMDDGRHLLLSADGAEEFARAHGLETVANSWFVTAERQAQLRAVLASGGFDSAMRYGTVGAVAVDRGGHVAAATSTGGLTAKRWGRIGDSPLIGCGTYADDRSAAVSATGAGEYFIRAAAAHELCARVRIGGEALQAAIDGVLAEVTALGGSGGLIAVSPAGEGGWGFSTAGMYRGRASRRGVEVAVYP